MGPGLGLRVMLILEFGADAIPPFMMSESDASNVSTREDIWFTVGVQSMVAANEDPSKNNDILLESI